mmetsp:Transcript_21474/g.63898  ORF Transcript_21474/g.63898 Transcript_21474/m.63898 type:complete len:154 (-) Transcript_21474:207-668(-)
MSDYVRLSAGAGTALQFLVAGLPPGRYCNTVTVVVGLWDQDTKTAVTAVRDGGAVSFDADTVVSGQRVRAGIFTTRRLHCTVTVHPDGRLALNFFSFFFFRERGRHGAPQLPKTMQRSPPRAHTATSGVGWSMPCSHTQRWGCAKNGPSLSLT